MAASRIRQEFQDLNDNPLVTMGISVALVNNNLFEWRCTMLGPSDSSYKNGLFYLSIKFDENYPNSKPNVKFITPIYHVNINSVESPYFKLGHICISTLNDWNDIKSSTSIRQVLLDIWALFHAGNPDDPFNGAQASEMKNNRSLFEQKIEYFTKKYADISLPFKEYNSWDFTYSPLLV